jgi:thiol-disulfide isomerase/thioredoxin
MRSRLTTAAMALVALALAAAPHTAASGARIAGVGAGADQAQRALASHPLATLDGRTLTLAELRGEVVVVNFWASWCAPCRHELPALDRLHADLARRGGRVLAVSIDLERRNAARFAKMNRLALPIAHDGPDGLAKRLDLRHVPFTIVLDRTGTVAFTTSGSDAASIAKVGEVARQLLAKSPVATTDTEGDTP